MLNKNIYEMILKADEVADDVVLITNGALLTEENSNKLIETGIKTIRVSLQGISEEDYQKTCGYKINFNNFLNNLEYLYKNKSEKTKLYLKIPDIAINTDERKNLFHKLFDDKCDYLVIQNIGNLFHDLDYSNIIINYPQNKINVCPQLFYLLIIDATGFVYPCCAMHNDIKVGDINYNNIVEIWGGAAKAT